MFTDESMKFKFHDKQILTTYAYEIPKSMKKFVSRNHFIHVALVDSEGSITYQTFPRLILYSDTEPLK